MTVLVTTSRMCRTVDRDSPGRFVALLTAFAVLGVVAAEVGPGPPGTSLYLRALRAASQSNGDRIDRELHGVLGESRLFLLEHAGDAGMFKLEKVRFDGGADMGIRGVGPSGLVGMAALLIEAVFGADGGGVMNFSFSLLSL